MSSELADQLAAVEEGDVAAVTYLPAGHTSKKSFTGEVVMVHPGGETVPPGVTVKLESGAFRTVCGTARLNNAKGPDAPNARTIGFAHSIKRVETDGGVETDDESAHGVTEGDVVELRYDSKFSQSDGKTTATGEVIEARDGYLWVEDDDEPRELEVNPTGTISIRTRAGEYVDLSLGADTDVERVETDGGDARGERPPGALAPQEAAHAVEKDDLLREGTDEEMLTYTHLPDERRTTTTIEKVTLEHDQTALEVTLHLAGDGGTTWTARGLRFTNGRGGERGRGDDLLDMLGRYYEDKIPSGSGFEGLVYISGEEFPVVSSGATEYDWDRDDPGALTGHVPPIEELGEEDE